MEMPNWVEEFDGAVTICNLDYTIVYMNHESKQNFARLGGADLIGKNLLECHNEESNKTIKKIIEEGITHAYIQTKKDGRVKAIQQSPWMENGKIKGIVEIMFYVEG